MQTAFSFWKFKTAPYQSSMFEFGISPLLYLQQSNPDTVNLYYIRKTIELSFSCRIDLTDPASGMPNKKTQRYTKILDFLEIYIGSLKLSLK